MQFLRNSFLHRSDTMLGVCQSLGEDFGISPTLLRVAIAAVVLVNMEAAIAIYLGLAAVVLVSRLVYPTREVAPAAAETLVTVEAEAPVVEAPRAAAPVLAEAA